MVRKLLKEAPRNTSPSFSIRPAHFRDKLSPITKPSALHARGTVSAIALFAALSSFAPAMIESPGYEAD